MVQVAQDWGVSRTGVAGTIGVDFGTGADRRLRLDARTWTTVVCEDRAREATGPAGEQTMVLDSIVRVVRHA